MWECLFSIEIQMAGPIGLKFGTEVVLEGGRFLGGFNPVPPPPGYRVRKGDHPIGPQIRIWKDLEPWSLTFKGSL